MVKKCNFFKRRTNIGKNSVNVFQTLAGKFFLSCILQVTSMAVGNDLICVFSADIIAFVVALALS